jgi:hypothetical protein
MLGDAVLGMRAVGSFFDPSASNPRRVFVFLLVLWVGSTVLAGILLVIWQ